MTIVEVTIVGPVAVVPTTRARSDVDSLHPDRSVTIESLVQEMSSRATGGALPAIVDSKKLILVYTSRHCCGLYANDAGDGYRLGFVRFHEFSDHRRLAQRSMLIGCSSGWRTFQQQQDLPQGAGRLINSWDRLQLAWVSAGPAPARPVLPEHHAAFLDLLTQAIDGTRDLEAATRPAASDAIYRQVQPAAAQRYSAASSYRFELLALPGWIRAGTHVVVADRPDLRGRVLRSDGSDVTIRFAQPIAFSRIPPQGALLEDQSDSVHRAQRAAVDQLRLGKARCPDLLTILVDHQRRGFEADRATAPTAELDDGQRDAFARALGISDQLLVLGPPGTGKTRTITEIAAATVERREKVLVTSHTNRAVDNVLERLPSRVLAVRVGQEDAVAPSARPYLVSARVDALKKVILQRTAGHATRLAPFLSGGDAMRWLDASAMLRPNLVAAEQALADHHAHLATTRRQIAGELPVLIEAAEAASARHRSEAQAARARLAEGPGLLGRLLSGWRQRQIGHWEAEQSAAEINAAQADEQAAALRLELEQALAASPQVVAAEAQLTSQRDERERIAAEFIAATGHVDRLLASAGAASPGDLEVVVASARTRAEVLAEWQEAVRGASSELEAELVRFADVIAATCIGTATSRLLGDVDFDLVIVDEAGQISMANLMVPLVRARRSVLVGDHHQLPPFRHEDTDQWLAAQGAGDGESGRTRELARLVEASGFELLYASADNEHRLMLDVQRRMPAEIAQFVSDTFYDGSLRTVHPGVGRGPMFDRPLAFVTTSDQPPSRRREQRIGDQRSDGVLGYVNRFEAELITRIVAAHRDQPGDWAVILPYRAQVDAVARRLTAVLGGWAADHVGTVDSFQGGERDLIVFGFTRSNSRGGIGFLGELRRLNVAVTRARRQLVLVGDLTMLQEARNPGFASLMSTLALHLDRVGEIRPSATIGPVEGSS